MNPREVAARAELVEDREISGGDEDRLRHADVARQLAHLVQTVPIPANVALYGAWGSGKSGIGNLLEGMLEGVPGLRFARFDAFKYAENPLRRNFISAVARSLEVKSDKYHAGLYRASVDTDFTVPPRKLWSLAGAFGAVVLVAAVAVSLVVVVSAALRREDVWMALGETLSAALPSTLVPAALLTALIAFVGKTFVVEKRVERAESDEEFERLFADLVDDSGADRLVVFVDELDRCSSEDVVETLKAIRTFLGVKKCVFVVAADAQALEQALTESLAQATPSDEVNPYYSVGSAYLDKVFQYQLAVPPLMPQSVTQFAASLVVTRPGVWQEVDRDVVVSILVPAHVRSPRRVKALLNAFVLSFRLAEARQRSGQLDVNVREHADALARLVCLRLEFPLFWRDLIADPSLPDYVLALEQAGQASASVWEKYPYVDARIQKAASEYANASRAVDTVLADGESEDVDVEAIQKTQGQQLLDYLSRTRSVTGPTRALIHLQSSGNVFGLDSLVADAIERDAQNGALQSLIERFVRLDAAQRAAAVEFLTQQGRSAVGLEVPNVARALLALIGQDETVLEGRADSLAVHVGGVTGQHPQVVDEATLRGAWRLAVSSARPEASGLGRLVLQAMSADGDDHLLQEVVASGATAVRFDRTRVAELLADRLLFGDGQGLAEMLVHSPPAERRALLSASQGHLSEALRSTFEAYDAYVAAEAEREAQATATTSRRAVPVPADDEDESDVVPPQAPDAAVRALTKLLRSLSSEAPDESEILLIMLLGSPSERARDAVESVLDQLISVRSQAGIDALLESCERRPLAQWSAWLRPIDQEAITPLLIQTRISALVAKLVDLSVTAQTVQADEIRAAGRELARLLDSSPSEAGREARQAASDVSGPLAAPEDLPAHLRRLDVAEILITAGLADPGITLVAEARMLSQLLDADLPEQPIESSLAEYVVAALDRILAVSPSPGRAQVSRALQVQVATSLEKCAWLSECDRALAVSVAASASPEMAERLSIPTLRDLKLYLPDLSRPACARLLASWLGVAADDPLRVARFLCEVDVKKQAPVDPVAVSVWRQRLPESDRAAVVSLVVEEAASSLPSKDLILALGLRDAKDADVASHLIDRYHRCTSNGDRQSVLWLWSVAHLQDDAARSRLIREVLLPMLALNSQATTMVLRLGVELLHPTPRGLRRTIGESILEQTQGNDALEKRGLRLLEDLGFKITSKGLLGRRKSADVSS